MPAISSISSAAADALRFPSVLSRSNSFSMFLQLMNRAETVGLALTLAIDSFQAAVVHSFCKSVDIYDQDIHLQSFQTWVAQMPTQPGFFF